MDLEFNDLCYTSLRIGASVLLGDLQNPSHTVAKLDVRSAE